MRIACLLVRDLPLAAMLRAQPELAGQPLVIASGAGPRAQVISASPEALRAGIRLFDSLVHARAALPSLQVQSLSPAREQSARGALLDVARSASPRVAPAPPGTGPWWTEAAVHLDATGIAALFHSETGLASALVARAAAIGLPAVAAVADSRAASLAAARQIAQNALRSNEPLSRAPNATPLRAAGAISVRAPGAMPLCTADSTPARAPRATLVRDQRAPDSCSPGDGEIRVIPPGGDGEGLAALSIDLFDAGDALLAALARFGVRCLGDLARLPRRGLVTRLGAGVVPLLALAHGETDALPLPSCEDDTPPEAIDLDAPIDRLDALAFVSSGLLDRCLERLALHGRVAGSLVLELGLEGGGRETRHISVSSPTNDVRALIGLLRLALERQPLAAPVIRVALGAIGAAPRRDQLDLFRPAGPAPAVLARLVAELEALCGEGRVGTPQIPDDLHPDALSLAPFLRTPPRPRTAGAAQPPRAFDAAPNETGTLVLRVLRPPAPAEVRREGDRPRWIRSRPASGRVLEAAGPWRTTGHWWSDTRFAFDHFDVRTEDDALIRLRRDLLRGDWVVDGTYD